MRVLEAGRPGILFKAELKKKNSYKNQVTRAISNIGLKILLL
jgi:hypothetical protein